MTEAFDFTASFKNTLGRFESLDKSSKADYERTRLKQGGHPMTEIEVERTARLEAEAENARQLNVMRDAFASAKKYREEIARLKDIVKTQYEMLEAYSREIAIRDTQKKILWQEIAQLRDALAWYKDQFCEGFCDASEWGDGDHAHPGIQNECSGCRAAAALLGLEDTP